MEKSKIHNTPGYKWRWSFSQKREGAKSFGLPRVFEAHLEALPSAKLLPSDYQHKPGDVDYSAVKELPDNIKYEILFHVATGADRDGLNSIATQVAACILLDRLTIPGFLPAELNPYN